MELDFEFISTTLKECGISYRSISEKIGMHESTFKLKLDTKFPQYSFKEEEKKKLIDAIKEISSLLKEIAG